MHPVLNRNVFQSFPSIPSFPCGHEFQSVLRGVHGKEQMRNESVNVVSVTMNTVTATVQVWVRTVSVH